ncbi:cystathionine beta-lyase [Sandarakinorhabdus sp.]|uniref:cystathionine beta-lyase n=1 Tax=Sandarakinorhabdus sp. TaxID=1916663 RepID=UPI003F6EF2DD
MTARRPTPSDLSGYGIGTRLTHAGRDHAHNMVNPAVARASTILFENLAALDAAIRTPDAGLYYGRRGTQTHWALEDALTALEPGAAGTKLFPSGVAAIATSLLACLAAGDELLVTDSAYEPSRSFADQLLGPLGITTRYIDPCCGAGIVDLISDRTRAILLESPGSLSFEIQDLPAITAVARARGITTIIDNTWATPLRLQPLALGVDISIQALTKYVGGHSDVMMGSATATAALWPQLKATSYRLGHHVSADDAALVLRGLRTLGVRLDRHEQSALAVARWLETHPAVAQVWHPALPAHPQHALFKRDFAGATGLFACVLKHGSRPHTAALIDGLQHFGIGFSWGGYESLVLPVELDRIRTATSPAPLPGPIVRLSIGLEDVDDLIADLDAGLARYMAQFQFD